MRKGIAYSIGICIVFTSFIVSQSCTKSTDEDELIGNWQRSSDFGGDPRSEAVTFIIGDSIYLATGLYSSKERYRDLWVYSVQRNSWSQRADLPAGAAARSSAVAFVIGNMGYVGTGYDGINRLNDFWRYDPVQNKWSPIAPFGGTARYDALAFSVNGKGYVGSGYDTKTLIDMWEYNPGTDEWIQKASIGTLKRTASLAFVVNNKAYVFSGNNNGSALNDLWVYDEGTDTWTEKRKINDATDESYDDDYSNIARYNSVALVINNKVYISTGENGSLISDTWEYDPATDLWTEKTGFEASARTGAASFSIGSRAFILTGRSGSQLFDDAYEWFPTAEQEDND